MDFMLFYAIMKKTVIIRLNLLYEEYYYFSNRVIVQNSYIDFYLKVYD